MAEAGHLKECEREHAPDGSKEKEEESGFVDLQKKTKFGDSQKNGGGSSWLSRQIVEIVVGEDGAGQPDRKEEQGTAAKDVDTEDVDTVDVDTEDVDTEDIDTEDVATEDAHPQSYEVNGVIPLMFQGSETCCDHDGKGFNFYNQCLKHILTEEQLQENGYPRPDPENMYTAKVYTPSNLEKYYTRAKLEPGEKICIRCSERFRVNQDGTYAYKEVCFYHWGKALKEVNDAGYTKRMYRSCCEGDVNVEGCTVAEYHVHESNKWENLTGYLQTLPCPSVSDGDYGVYAMDTEMVYTQDGLELARVTVVDCNNKVVYDTFVRPDTEVIDYNTRFSGIYAKDMDDVTTTIRDVQAVLLSLIAEETILIGHSLECDLTAVKVIHSKVVDTAVLFPDDRGPGFKPALKTLVAKYLEKTIQDDAGSHDSQEDAIACIELMQWLVKEDA